MSENRRLIPSDLPEKVTGDCTIRIGDSRLRRIGLTSQQGLSRLDAAEPNGISRRTLAPPGSGALPEP
jgi:hypothetical protein